MNDNKLENIWREKLTALPDAIIQRLDLASLPTTPGIKRRCLVTGTDSKVIGPLLEEQLLKTGGWKVFTGITFEAFPANTLDLVILLWPTMQDDIQILLKNMYQRLKTYGQCVLITSFDGVPKLPWKLLAQALKEYDRKNKPLKIYPSGLPQNTAQLRKLMTRMKFNDARVWEDGVNIHYHNGDTLFDDLVRLSPNGIFHSSVNSQMRDKIQQVFGGLFDEQLARNGIKDGITITYPFGGAIGIK
jgi:hypothetical protein